MLRDAHDRLRAVLTDGTPPDTLGQRPSITAILGASASCISFATAACHWALVRYDYVADLERDAHNLNGTPWLLRVRAGEADPCLGR